MDKNIKFLKLSLQNSKPNSMEILWKAMKKNFLYNKKNSKLALKKWKTKDFKIN